MRLWICCTTIIASCMLATIYPPMPLHGTYHVYVDAAGNTISTESSESRLHVYLAGYVHIFPHARHNNFPYTRFCGYDQRYGWIDVTQLGAAHILEVDYKPQAITQESINTILQAENYAIQHELFERKIPQERYFYILSRRLPNT